MNDPDVDAEVRRQMVLLECDLVEARQADQPLWADRISDSDAWDNLADYLQTHGVSPHSTTENPHHPNCRPSFSADQWERDHRGIVDGEGNTG